MNFKDNFRKIKESATFLKILRRTGINVSNGMNDNKSDGMILDQFLNKSRIIIVKELEFSVKAIVYSLFLFVYSFKWINKIYLPILFIQ